MFGVAGHSHVKTKTRQVSKFEQLVKGIQPSSKQIGRKKSEPLGPLDAEGALAEGEGIAGNPLGFFAPSCKLLDAHSLFCRIITAYLPLLFYTI